MSGAHTLVLRPVSNVYALTLVANTTFAPLQLVPTTNEIASFVSLLNTGTAPVLVRMENVNQNLTLVLPASGSNVEGFILPANMIYPIVIPSPQPTAWIQAISSAAVTLYAQLVQNH